MISATQIRPGQILKIEQDLFRVLKVQHITPGKGNAVVQSDLRNLRTKSKHNMRFRSSETVEQVELNTRNLNFLYQDGDNFHFMDPNSYEQVEISADVLEETTRYLKPETSIMVSSYEGKPVSVTLPAKMNFTITECDPPSKGVAGAFKDAILDNGMKIKGPLFLKVGDSVVISTETGDYLEKSKE